MTAGIPQKRKESPKESPRTSESESSISQVIKETQVKKRHQLFLSPEMKKDPSVGVSAGDSSQK